MPTKSISTQQSAPLDASTYLLLGLKPVTIFDIEGEVSSTTGTNYYIQVLGTATPVSGTTLPLYSRLVVPAAAGTGNNGFSFVYRPIGLNTSTMSFPEGAATGGSNSLPVYLAISSTDNVYTSVAASTQVQVTVEDTYLEIPNQVITGDTTNATDSLPVWGTPGVTKKLVQFQVTNTNVGATAYLMLFAYSPANGDVPLQQWPVANGATITERFGSGWQVQQSPAYVLKTGCYLVGSSTTQTLTKTTGTNWKMKAWNI